MKKLITVLAVLLASSTAFAETYWVSPTGTETSLANCSGATPISGTAACTIQTIFDGMVAGDVGYFRAGAYICPDVGTLGLGAGDRVVYEPGHSGTAGNYITFAAYDSEDVFIDNSINHNINGNVGTYGTYGQDYIIFDGLDARTATAASLATGCAVQLRNNSNNIVIRNAVLQGRTAYSNNSHIRVEDVNYVDIYNNYFYDSDGDTDQYNTNGVELYGSDNIKIYNNEFNATDNGIYVKEDNSYIEIYNNFIHTLQRSGIRVNPWSLVWTDISIHNNVILNTQGGVQSSTQSGDNGGYIDGLKVFNNTMYGISNESIEMDSGGPNSDYRNTEIYNNIIVGNGSTTYYERIPPLSGVSLIDYNQFWYVTAQGRWDYDYTAYTTLSSWQSVTNYGDSGGATDGNSTVSNPNFLNAGGSYALVTDFKRSSYPTDGYSSTVIGAYQTGSESIGYDGVGGPVAVAQSPSGNFSIH